MLDEYKNSEIWKENINEVNLRSDVLVTERVLGLLKDVKGKKILDAGCGNGKVSQMLVRQGATVYGVDITEDQIKIAQKENSDVKYFCGDITNLSALNIPHNFDIVISLMTFLYLDKEQFKKAVEEIKKTLVKGGTFIYANIHPDRYPKEFESTLHTAEIPTTTGKTFTTTFYHHPMSFISKTFSDAGFEITETLTPHPTKEEIEKYPTILSQNDTATYLILQMVSR